MKKFLIVKQDGYKECGAASLLSIIRYYKGNVSINRLVELTYTDKSGTNFYNLKNAAEKIGLEAIGYKVAQASSIKEIKQPFLCQLVDHHYEHFVVVYEVKKNKVIVMDPASGFRTISFDEFVKQWTGYIMIFSPKRKLLFHKDERYLNQIIMETMKKNKGIILSILLLSIIFALVSCLSTVYFQMFLDFIVDTTKNNLLALTFLFAVLLIIKCVTSFFRNELLIFLNQKIDCSLLLNTYRKLLLLPYSYYKNRTTGEVVSRINDLIYVKNILNKIILTVCLDFIVFICCGVILLYVNPVLFLFLIIVILIYGIVFCIFRPILKNYTHINQKNNATMNSFLIESISGFETIKNIGTESIMNERMEEIYTNCLDDSFAYDNISNLELFLKELISGIGILLIEFLGLSFVMDGKLSIGIIFTYMTLANYFIEPFKNIIDLNKEYFYALSSLKRANHLFEVEEENLSTKTNFVIEGDIRLSKLSFSYNLEKNILQEIDFVIKKGSKVMIIGDSGSGKSTILKLLLKYYPVKRDSIYLGDVDLNDYSVKDVRDNIVCMSQNEILYTDTIKNNIVAYRNIADDEFMEVCRLTGINEFVKGLFLGYDTKLEENGLNISGGQRQRIILARMLLKPSKIILIDEGLNAIDINLERKILKNIFSKYSEKTIIVVSHRLENMDLFNQVIQLENGQLKDVIKYPKERLYDE